MMKAEELSPLNEKHEKIMAAFGGITNPLNNVLHLPKDLHAKKRGAIVCLGICTIGLIAMAIAKAPWYYAATEAALTTLFAGLILNGKRKTQKRYNC